MFEQVAYAAGSAPEAGGASPLIQLLPILFFFLIFYFLLIRPQRQHQQRLQKLVSELKKGDHVTTSGGMIGTVTSIQSDYVVLKLGDNDNTKVEILKSSITGLRAEPKA